MANNSYRSIAKANTIFGGVQIFNIIIGIIRSKVVAVLLGPHGVGLMGLFQSTIDLVRAGTNCGLQTSAVRDVSIAHESGDREEVSLVKSIVNRLVWLTGFLGTVLTIIFAPQLSDLTFGSYDYTLEFRVLSIIVLVSQLTAGANVVLQGTRQLKKLALANMFGGLTGLVINIPLFYIWGEDAIVAVLIINAIVLFFIAKYNVSKLNITNCSVNWKQVFRRGSLMLKMGFLIGLTGLMDYLVIYIIKVGIQKYGSLEEVGLYTAGYAIITQYVSLIFGAIATDYYPRLSAASKDKDEYSGVINKQFEILILVLLPMIMFFIALSPYIIRVLYTEQFVSISSMVNWIAVGMLFRAASWCPGFLYLAKGDSSLYFITYVITFILEVVFYLLFYKIWGLTGIGIAFCFLYVLSFIATILIAKFRYHFSYDKSSVVFLILSIACGVVVLIIDSFIVSVLKLYILLILACILSYYCLKELNRRLDFKASMSKLRTRFKK